MKQEQKIAAVVVTYNRKELLMQCISCLLTQTQAVCDVLVVDNASTDGTQQAVKNLQTGQVLYKNTGQNLGGAGGFQFGMRWALESGYDYVWIMDDDTLPQPDALAELWHAHQTLNGKYGFLASVVLWKDGKECRMNRPKIKKSFYEYIERMRDGIVQIEQATFVSLFFPAKVIRQVGLPIKEYFIWGDDIEYTRRISVRYGMPCFLAGKSSVVHMMQHNTGSNIATDVPERIDRYRYAFRNENYTYRQEGVRGVLYYLGKCGLNFVRIVGKAKDHKLKRIGVLLSSMVTGLFFNPSIEQVNHNCNQ